MRPLTRWQMALTVITGACLFGALSPVADAQAPTPVRFGAGSPSPTIGGSPTSALGGATVAPMVVPLATGTTTAARGDVAATQTVAIATIAAADAVATSRAGVPLTAVAATATRFAQPTQTPFPSATVPPSPTRLATTTALTSPTAATTATPLPPSPTTDPLSLAREVLLAQPITLGGESLEPGATLLIPSGVALAGGAIPAGTVVRLPSGSVVTVPPNVRVMVAEGLNTVPAPLNVTFAQGVHVGDADYAAGAALVLPTGTVVLGRLDPGSLILLLPGTTVQVDGRMQALAEPVAVIVSGAPVAAPATLPRTGDAEPVLWPMVLGLALVLLGWRLRLGADSH